MANEYVKPMKAWMRILKITLTTSNAVENNGKVKQITFGYNEDSNKYHLSRTGNVVRSSDLSISISGDKYMSTLKDTCTIKISNLTYHEIIRIIQDKYYNVKIECGYKSANTFTIFEGGVMYISNFRQSVETNTVTILCASHLVAKYGQSRLNLSFNSGINLYSAIKFVCKVGNVPNPNLSTQFKKSFLDSIMNCKDQSAADVISGLADKNGSYITNSDCVGNSFMTMYDADKSNARVVDLQARNCVITNGFPRMTADGLAFSILPTIQLQCGDVIKLDPSLIQLNITSQSNASKNLGGLIDPNGLYTIFEMHYELKNRGNDFYIQINAKSRSKISAYIGGNNG